MNAIDQYNYHKIPSRRPLDIPIGVTLLISLLVPSILYFGFQTLSHQGNASASYSDNTVMIPGEDDILRTYQDNLAYTAMVSESQAERESRSQVLGSKVTTGAVFAPNSSQVLAVPQIKQIYRLSCEFAAMEMVLKYFGTVDKDQDTLIAQLGYATPVISQFEGDKMIWGDPDKGFVGDVDGYMVGRDRGIRGATGWGTHKGPVANVLKQYYPSSYAGQGSIDNLKSNLDQNRPVIFWHVRDDASTDVTTYYTPEGKVVELKQYHVAVIIGYEVGEDGQPTFVVNDPLYGTYKIDRAGLTRIWGKHNFDMVVAVK